MPDPRDPFSNFQPAVIVDRNGLEYPTVEHFFFGMSTLDPKIREVYRTAKSPKQAKFFSHQYLRRPDWDKIKLAVMWYAYKQKFACGTEYHRQLLETPDERLVHWNTWHDHYWGYCTRYPCTGVGENWNGRLQQLLKSRFFAGCYGCSCLTTP